MHSNDELKEMEARERQKKEKEKVNAVKRKLQYEQSQREQKEKKKEKEHKTEREGNKRKAKERKQTTPRKCQVEVVSLFSSNEQPAAKKGRIYIFIYEYIFNIYNRTLPHHLYMYSVSMLIDKWCSWFSYVCYKGLLARSI